MTKTKRIILICICSLLIVATMVAMIFAAVNYYGGKNKAHAEFIDIIDSNTLVNFNQCILDQYINNAPTGQLINPLSNLSFNQNDKVLIRFDNLNSAEVILAFHNNTTSAEQNLTYHSSLYNIITINGNYDCILSYIGANGIIKNLNVINLTKMFGSGNEPNLEQAQAYFISEYYNYNAGSAVSSSAIESYNQGVKSVYDNLYFKMDSDLIIRNMQPYKKEGQINSSYVYKTDAEGAPYTYTMRFDRGCYVPFNTKLPINSAITISLNLAWQDALNGTINMDVMFMDDQGNLQYVDTWTTLYDNISQDTDVLSYPIKKFTYYTNANVVGLVLTYSNSIVSSGSAQYVIMYPEIDFRTGDISILLDNSQAEIEKLIKKEYDNYYSQGGAGYQTIWSKGFNAGALSNGDATLSTMDYVGAAFRGIGDILQIELLPGVPFSLFVLLPLMVSLIFFVVKLTKGGS